MNIYLVIIKHSGKNYIQGGSSVTELKSRLKGFVHRTLRKDVLEYVKYTQRQALTVPFTPTDQEQALYDDISILLECEESYALPRKQKHLISLIVRKLLASSSYAVLNTLQIILQRLESLKDDTQSDYDFVGTLIDEDDFVQDGFDFNNSFEAWDTHNDDNSDLDKTLLEDEIQQIKRLINQAKSIRTDSKATALLTALSQGFEKMADMGAPRKAIIFTESKRTQAYLLNFLNTNGFGEKIVTFNGSNNHPQATEIYKQWLIDNQDSDKISGSAPVDRRSALIDYFKYHAEVMIATEAAAEGINLQFCSLLINYDLPWNPQRVEQRIGRCHRYGQKFDVVVINFLNSSNQADQRVLELLSEKFHLFDGVFGASDEVLGSIESGVDFEKRIQAIYETCRQPKEIESAFQQLQKELEADINAKMLETRQLLLENFDEDIHGLLKIQLDAAEQRLDKVGRWFWTLTQHELKNFATFNESNHSFQLTSQITSGQHSSIQKGIYQLLRKGAGSNENTLLEHAHRYRLSTPLGEWVVSQAVSREVPSAHLVFDYAAHNAKVSVIENLQGKSGALSLQKFSIESLESSEDYLLFAAVDNQGNVIPSEVAQKLMQFPAYEENQAGHIISEQSPVEEKLNGLLDTERNQVEKNVNDRNLTFFEDEVNKLDAWADDLKEGLEQSIKELDKAIKQVRREAKIAPTLEEKLSLQKQQKKLESQRNRSRRDLFDKQDEVDERREALIESLEGKLNKQTTIETLFTVQWRVK